MAKNSGIGWTHHTFNAWWGCAKASSGCLHCYADAFQHRYGHDTFGYRPDGSRKPLRTFAEAHWREPLKWDAAAARAGERHRVFCASMSDVFDDHPDARPERERLWGLIRATPNLDWLLLTKRPEHILWMLPNDWGGGYPNVWMGTTVEGEATVHRIALLTRVPVHAVRFLSIEPLVQGLDLGHVQVKAPWSGVPELRPALDFIHWVIVGGESGAGARRMEPAWVDQVLADCARHPHVRVFVKQLGSVLARERGTTGKGEVVEDWPDHWRVQAFPIVHSSPSSNPDGSD